MSLALNAYQSMSVTTASPGQAVVSLYDGALRFTRDAARSYAAGNVAEGGRATARVECIIFELMGALDFERGGEVAAALFRLYQYMIGRFPEIRASRGHGLRDIETLLSGLRDAFASADRSLRQQRTVP